MTVDIQGPGAPLVVLDANCFINATDVSSTAHAAVRRLFAAAVRGELRLGASLHTITELANGSVKDEGRASALASTCEQLPYYPIGSIDDLLGSIDGLAGTLGDMDENEAIQQRLRVLAKAGASLADRGALLDAERAGATVFVTSDGQLVKRGPRSRIESEIRLRLLTPEEAVYRLLDGG